ncbi:MAG TPA: GAP family protein [Acidimicrobiales bacterium]|jgi:hypothetical protein|nr:GAP family protein [Acidimicrobiales bacterium]
MNQAIGESITFAIGVAISPLPIMAVILMLLSRRSGANSLAFLIGWFVGVAGVLAGTLAVSAAIGLSTGGTDTADGNSTLKLVLGIVLIVLGLRRMRQSRVSGQPAAAPKWLTSIEEIGPAKATGLGILLAGLNPKNLILIIGGGTAIAGTSATFGQKFVAAVVFVALASIAIVVPVLTYRLAREKAAPLLGKWRDWLATHAAATVGVVVVVLGVLLVGKGVGGF